MNLEYDLVALERETRSSKYPSKPFGYEYNMDMREIEDQMISEGFLRDTPTFIFEGSTRYLASKKGDLTMRQRRDLAAWLGLKWAGGSAAVTTNFTSEELLYLKGRIDGANDETGTAILVKLKRLIEAEGTAT
jgi:hypothetical protein